MQLIYSTCWCLRLFAVASLGRSRFTRFLWFLCSTLRHVIEVPPQQIESALHILHLCCVSRQETAPQNSKNSLSYHRNHQPVFLLATMTTISLAPESTHLLKIKRQRHPRERQKQSRLSSFIPNTNPPPASKTPKVMRQTCLISIVHPSLRLEKIRLWIVAT